jgi:hypothetical protein
MITQIDDDLFLGNAAAAANPVMPETGRGLLEAHGVKAVLNATEDRDPSPALFGSGIEYVQFPFRDFSHNPMDEGKLWEAVQWIDERISHGKPVFIHCHAGIGRSGSLVVAYLLLCKYPEKSFDAVVALVNERLRHQRHTIYPHVGIPESVARVRMAIAERTANAQQFVHEQPVGEVLAVSFDTLVVEDGGVHTTHQLGVGHHVELRRGSRCLLRVTVHHTGARPRGVYLYTNLNRDGPAFERRLMEPVAGHAATYQAELIPERCGDDFWITAFATPRQYDHDVKARWIGGNLWVRVTERADPAGRA